MALLDFLKRKRARQDALPVGRQAQASGGKNNKKARPAQKARPIEAGKESKPVVQPIKTKRTVNFSYDAVREPHISEKATNLADKNQYIFKVSENFNKKEIKKAVEGVYGVDVLSVNVIKIPAKKRRIGRIQGHKKSYIKAVVKIKEGQKIEIL